MRAFSYKCENNVHNSSFAMKKTKVAIAEIAYIMSGDKKKSSREYAKPAR